MKAHVFFLMLIALVAVSCNLKPSIDYLRVCNNPDYDKTCPADNSVLAASETNRIFVTATISHVPEATELGITWYYLEGGENVINSILVKTDEDMVDMPVYSYVDMPEGGWPKGKYKVVIDLKLDDFSPAEKEFTIE
ncbi:hypothetical protein SDC9_64929 [bioreactor metagenome]|uniref:Lipoprotein n=1 Tax=bioreactor metagenome TaxID=1076179 RepID=A0A644XRI0_9ZZZZ